MSNAKIRARRIRRARLGWTKALTPIELSIAPDAPASFKLQEYVEHTCSIATFVPAELKKSVREVLRAWHSGDPVNWDGTSAHPKAPTAP